MACLGAVPLGVPLQLLRGEVSGKVSVPVTRLREAEGLLGFSSHPGFPCSFRNSEAAARLVPHQSCAAGEACVSVNVLDLSFSPESKLGLSRSANKPLNISAISC